MKYVQTCQRLPKAMLQIHETVLKTVSNFQNQNSEQVIVNRTSNATLMRLPQKKTGTRRCPFLWRVEKQRLVQPSNSASSSTLAPRVSSNFCSRCGTS
ncbi:hypothetical protein, partial [Enterobacter hormaechei]|uniref:hypothetical protein n=1 Tax=Enterobacter hormaechei TaxID=158836 RepID=UPI001F3AF15E